MNPNQERLSETPDVGGAYPRLSDEQIELLSRCGEKLLFAFIGAQPCTGWLASSIALDERGYVLTGAQVRTDAPQPVMLETSRPGVLAVGDVRSGSIKRVASAVGEGSMAVRLIHDHLARFGDATDRQRSHT